MLLASARLGLRRIGGGGSAVLIKGQGFFPRGGLCINEKMVQQMIQQPRKRFLCNTKEESGGIMDWPKKNPFTFQVVIATFKTSAADYLVQRYLEGKEEIDWARNAVFVAFGCLYLGVFQWWLYVTKFKQWFPNMAVFCNQTFKQKLANTAGMLDLGKQVAFDNFVHYTFIYFPVFYVFKEAIQGPGGLSGVTDREPTEIVSTAISKYVKNFWSDNFAIWSMWIPMDAIIYAVPIWMRLPLNHGVSLCWTMVLSFMRGDSEGEEAEVSKAE